MVQDLYLGREIYKWFRLHIFLHRRIIKDQFERIRDADRFWFENTENEIFSTEEIASIKDIKLWDVIVNLTDIKEDEIQPKEN